MTGDQDNFRTRVYKLVAEIPFGRVMTYGDVAACCGVAHAARIVGGLAHFGPPELPWHRVVNRFGGLAAGFPGGRQVQATLLEAENIECRDGIIQNFKDIRWLPII